MADNVFARSPLNANLDAQAAPPPSDPFARFDDLGRSAKVAPNVLMSIGEAAGAKNPDEAYAIAQRAAAKLAPLIASGMTEDDAIAAALGPQGKEAAAKIIQRAYQIADELRPLPPPAPVEPASLARKVADAGVSIGVGGVANDFVVGGVRGAGELLAAAENKLVLQPFNAAAEALGFGRPARTATNPLGGPADWASDALTQLQNHLTSAQTAQDIQNSQITGDILHPSTISLGKDPSINGIVQQSVRVFGSMAGAMASAYLTGGSSVMGAGLGMVSAAGDQAQQSDQTLDAMAANIGPDGKSQLEKESMSYREHLAAGMDPHTALEATKDEASQLAALLSAPIGAIGGALEAKILNPAEKILEKSGIVPRVAGRAALGAMSEGAQEAGEGAAGVVGMNAAVGTHEDPMAGSAGNAILGGIGGGAAAAAAGAMSPAHVEPAPGPKPSLDVGAAPAPLNGLPGPTPGPAPAAPGAAPGMPPGPDPAGSNPFRDAAGKAPPSNTNYTPGSHFTVDPGDGFAPFHAEFIRDTADGPLVREDDGTETVIPREHLNSGRVRMQPVEPPSSANPGVPPNEPPPQPAPEQPAPQPAPPPPPQPAAPPRETSTFGKRNGDPFPDAKSAARGGMSRLGDNQFTIHAVEGGFMVEPLPLKEPPHVQPAPPPAAPPVQNPPGPQATAVPPESGPAVAPTPPPASAPAGAAPGTGQAAAPGTPGQTPPEAPPGLEPTHLQAAHAELGHMAGMAVRHFTAKPAPITGENRSASLTAGELKLGAGPETNGIRQFSATFRPDATGSHQLAGMMVGDKPAEAPRQKRQVIDAIKAAYPEFLAAAPQPKPNPTPKPRDPNQDHRDAVQHLEDNNMAAFDKLPAMARISGANFHLDYTKGFEKKAPAILDAAGSPRPTNDELEAILKKATVSRMQQGEALNVNGVGSGLRAWAKVYAAEKGWNPFKGRFRQPSDSFKAWLKEPAAPPPVTTPKGEENKAPTAPEPPAGPPPVTTLPPHKVTKQTSGTDKGMFVATATDGPHKGVVGMADHTEDGARKELARAIKERVDMGIGVAPAAPDAAAMDAAAAAADTAPTDGQKDAGNYQKGHILWNGLDLSIENAMGSERTGTAPDGHEWSVTMPAHYGYIKLTEGADGEHVDFYMGKAPKSPKVLIIDQTDPETGVFDEHKVMLGFVTGKEARQVYIDGFSDGKGEKRIGGAVSMSVDEFKAWLASGTTALPVSDQMKATQKKAKLEDFGDKIGGARKDRAERALDELKAERNTKTLTISEAFPEPDYAALVASGIPADRVAFVAILRSSIDRKPTNSYRVDTWAREVDRKRKASHDALTTTTPLVDILKGIHGMQEDAAFAAIIAKVPADMIGEAAKFGYHPNTTAFGATVTQEDGTRHTPRRMVTGVTRPDQPSYSTGTVFEAGEEGKIPAYIVAVITQVRAAEAALDKTKDSGRKPVDLTVSSDYTANKVNLYYVTFKVTDVIRLAGPFATAAEAARYLQANTAELQKLADEKRDGLVERRSTNRPRTGPRHRKGDATPAMFMKAFGFKGVEFGNWNSGPDRQMRLNEAYDALMDMAGALRIPTQAISLNGTLSLAFGSRGHGGRRPAAAHYEPDYVAINLTKMNGAGSLAHEWFHAVDNWLAKEDAKHPGSTKAVPSGKGSRRDEYMTDRLRYADSGALEPVYKAFKILQAALKNPAGAWFKRSVQADKGRTTPYYGTTIELAARAFEKIINDRLASRDMVNDFLANINERGGAYPTTSEARRQGVTKAMDAALTEMSAQLATTTDSTDYVDLPPIIPGLIQDGPQIGFVWEGLTGERKIVDRAGDQLTVEYTTPEGATKTGLMDLDTTERLIDKDLFDTSDEGRTTAQVEAEAMAASLKAAAELQAERDAAKALAEEYATATHGDMNTSVKRATMANLEMGAHLHNFPRMSVVAAMLRLMRSSEKWRAYAPERGKPVGFYSDHGSYYGAKVWNKDALDFAVWMGKRLDAELRAANPEAPAETPTPTPEAAPDRTAADDTLTDSEIEAALEAAWKDRAETAASPEAKLSAEARWDMADAAARAKMMTDAGMSDEVAGRYANRDWKDLTATAQSAVQGQRTAGEAGASAVRNAAEALKAAAAGLNAMFIDPNRLGSGPVFDEESYQKAKPFFAQALKAVGRAGMDLMAMARALVDGLALGGITEFAQQQIKPLMMRYLRAVVSGTENPWAEDSQTGPAAPTSSETKDQTDEQGPNGSDISDQLADSPAGDLQGPADSVPHAGGAGSGGSGSGGNEGNGMAGPDAGPNLDGGGTPVPQDQVPSGTEPNPDALKGVNPGDFTIPDDFQLGIGTDGEKLTANIAAIALVKELIAEHRHATRDEQAVLARYVGWGGLKNAFSRKSATDKGQWGRAYQFLKKTLTKDEYAWAQESVLNAHYTAPGVVKAMWRAMTHFGFTGGRALEPTIGTGNFLGLQEEGQRASTDWYGTEIDPITGQIASFLYPSARISAGAGFQDVPFAKGAFDIAIGNPPFGSERIRVGVDKSLNNMKIHNYIIAKTATHLRPGGIMSMVVTHRFLDTADPEARQYLAKDFKFLGAVRLPNDAFRANAGTDVVTDVIFMQRLQEGEKPDLKAPWLNTKGKITVDGADMQVNRYFEVNPHHILGRSAMDGTMYGAAAASATGEYTVHSDGRDIGAAFDAILTGDWADKRGVLGTREAGLDNSIALETVSTLPVGRMLLAEDGKIYRRMMDTAQGANVVEIKPDSLWADNAHEWAATLNLLRQIHSLVKLDNSAELARNAKDMANLLRHPNVAGNTIFTQEGNARADKSGPFVFTHAVILALDKGDVTRLRSLDWLAGMGHLEDKVQRAKLGEERYARLKGMLDLRRKTLALIHAEANDARNMENLRGVLNRAYDAFVATHGYVNNRKNAALMRNDTGQPFGLESRYVSPDDSTQESAEKAPILTKRMIYPHVPPTTAASAEDAATISLQERGKIDFPYMATLTGKDPDEIRRELMSGARPRIFFDPASEDYVEASEYLSGNVKKKAAEATRAGLPDNARALQEAFPVDRTRAQVTPSIRSMWMPPEVFKDYLKRMGVEAPVVQITPEIGNVQVNGRIRALSQDGAQFDNKHKDVLELFSAAVTGKQIRITWTDDQKKVHLDEPATEQVNALVNLMVNDFEAWAYDNEDRADLIVRTFNDKLNVFAQRAYDGKTFLKMVGSNPEVSLRTTQKNASYRIIRSPRVLVHHVVGAGKTYTAIAAIMERRRMGLSKKPLIVVPNHLVAQWEREFLNLYPGANLLAASNADFEGSNRRILFSRMVTGNFDAIIIGHSSLSYIKNNPEDEANILREQTDELEAAIRNAEAAQGKKSKAVGMMVKTLKNYRERLKALLEKPRDDIGFDFKHMGVDHLTIDEAHEFKNLEYQSSADRVVGMNPQKGSKKAFDLYVKTRAILARKGGTAHLTGTPISNSLVEIYSFLKYLARDQLAALGMAHFDAWSAAFARTETRFEYTATQTLQARRVLAGMVNLHVLSDLYQSVADIALQDKVTAMYAEQIHEENLKNGTNLSEVYPIPKVLHGGRRLLTAPPTTDQTAFTDYLVARMMAIKERGKPYMSMDNALWVLSDARKVSIDIRTADPLASRAADSKVVRIGNEIMRIWEDTNAVRGTQIMFCDQSVPSKAAEAKARSLLRDYLTLVVGKPRATDQIKKWVAAEKPFAWQWVKISQMLTEAEANGEGVDSDAIDEFLATDAADAEAVMVTGDTGFSFYDDLRTYLMEQGVPRDQVEFIHDHNTQSEKTALFDKVNEGRVRILFGSTPKLGAGTNIQKRIVAIHHADAPWKPAEIEQREGRGIRQGNSLYEADPENFRLEILAYSTQGTADVVLWTVLQRKAAAIEEFLNGTLNRMDEDGGDADKYAEFMAQSTGNPIFRLNMQTAKDLIEEDGKTAGVLRAKGTAREVIASYPGRKRTLTEYIGSLEKAKPADLQAMVKYVSQTGSLAEYKTVIAEARAAYDEAYGRYLNRAAEIEQQRKDMRQAGTPEKELPGFPAAPSRPSLASKAVQEKSSYARLVVAAIDGMSRYDGAREVIKIGDQLRVTVTRIQGHQNGQTVPGIEGTLQTATGSYLDNERSLTSSAALAHNVLSIFEPAYIESVIARRLTLAQDDMKTLETRKTAADAAVLLKADTTRRDMLRDLSAFYKDAAEVAEVQEMRKRLSRDNRFVARDRIRDVGTGVAEVPPPLTRINFELEGVEYDGTGLTSAGMGDNTFSGVFETHRKSDGRLAYIRAVKTKGQTGWEAIAVNVMPPEAETAMQGEEKPRAFRLDGLEAEPIASEAVLQKIEAEVNAELKRTGLWGKINLRLAKGFSYKGEGLRGFFFKRTIGVGTDGTVGALGILRHEMIHALRSSALWGTDYGVFTQQEWQTLVTAARADRGLMAQIREVYPTDDASTQIEEVIAEHYRQWAQTQDATSLIGRIFVKLHAALTALINGLMGNGFHSTASIFEAIRSGQQVGRQETARAPAPRVFSPDNAMVGDTVSPRLFGAEQLRAMKMTEPLTDTQSQGLIQRAITQAMAGDWSMLGFVPGRPLFAELGRKILSAKTYLRLKEEMDAMRDSWHNRADQVAQRWRKLIANDGEGNARLMDLMHETTLLGQDPTKVFRRRATELDRQKVRTLPLDSPEHAASQAKIDEDQKRYATYLDLRKRFAALPEPFQAMYKEVRDTYSALADQFESAVLANIEKAMRINIRRAERAHADRLTKINDDGLVGGERSEAIAEADAKLERTKRRLGWGSAARTTSLRSVFESNRLEGPYFPLTRFGEFFATVRDQNRKVVAFSRFETVGERDRFAAAEAKNTKMTVETGVVEDNTARKMVDPSFVADVEQMIGEAGVSHEVMDAIWQRWLQTLPELSVRRNRIHRKGTEGFDTDAFRSFGRHMFHGAHQLARVSYGMEMTDALIEAQREAQRGANPTRDGLIVKEMERRNDYTMNPKGSWISQALTAGAFVYYLSMSPASALNNITQSTIVGIPVMATLNPGKGGFAQAAKQLSRAMVDFTRGRGHAANSVRLTDDEKAAMAEAYRRGTVDKSQSHDLAGVADSGVERGFMARRLIGATSRISPAAAEAVNRLTYKLPARQKVMSAISWFFHQSERMNREVTYLASYRMAKMNGSTHADAIERAADITWRTHFDYQNSSRPRAMQGNVARVALAFRNYNINLIWRLFRDTYQAVSGEDAATKLEARKQLFGITGSMMLHAGISGTWLFGITMMIASLVFGKRRDDLEEEMKAALVDQLGPGVGGALWYGIPGRVLGVDVSQRIGMPDLWFRSPDQALEGDDEFNYWLQQFVGAVPAIALNTLRGLQKINAGQTERGVETIAPKSIRDLMKAYRYWMEGATTAKGDPLVDQVPSWDVLMQAIGYTPAAIAELNAANNKRFNAQLAIEAERGDLLAAAAKDELASRPISKENMAAILAFNAAYPDYPILASSVNISARARAAMHARNEEGISLNPKLNERLREQYKARVFN